MRTPPEPPKRDTQSRTRGSFASGGLGSALAGSVVAAAAGAREAGLAAAAAAAAEGFAGSGPRGAPFAPLVPAGLPFAGFGGAASAAAFVAVGAAAFARSGRGRLALDAGLLRRARRACVAERTCSGEIVVAPALAARLAASSASASIARGTPNVAPWMSRQALRENIADAAPPAPPGPARCSR